jgi:hypothetical protein
MPTQHSLCGPTCVFSMLHFCYFNVVMYARHSVAWTQPYTVRHLTAYQEYFIHIERFTLTKNPEYVNVDQGCQLRRGWIEGLFVLVPDVLADRGSEVCMHSSTKHHTQMQPPRLQFEVMSHVP